MEACKQLTILDKAICSHQWNAAIARIKHAPHEASALMYNNLLPLHHALYRNPPSCLIRALLTTYPEAIKIRTKEGDLPLHCALKHYAPVEIVQMLLEEYPESLIEKDKCGETSLEIVKDSCVGEIGSWAEDVTKVLERGVEFFKDKKGGKKLDEEDKEIKEYMKEELEKRKSLETTGDEVEGWKNNGLVIVVIGASGDLAKKKTYPSLFNLYETSLLPESTIIWGYARSKSDHDSLRKKLKPFLLKANSDKKEQLIDEFLSKCYYQQGSGYGDIEAFQSLAETISKHEKSLEEKLEHNRLFYFAIPPNVFSETGMAIHKTAMAPNGWTRMIVEKPFGRDLESCKEILSSLDQYFKEEELYRIDHYLGKEMVQNLLVLRFSNLWLERVWNRDNVKCVFCTFKEPFGTEGRGGYFDKYGIIRDIIQNHLMQVLSMLVMETPIKVDGPGAGHSIRDAKVAVLQSIPPITIEDCFLGQYRGYTDDPTITDKDSTTPTFAIIRCFIHTPRWAGVPIILKAGKALNERKAETRIQFKDPPAADFLFDSKCPRNELVLRLQPDEAIYMKTNVKSPGFTSIPIQGELEVNYDSRFFTREGKYSNPDAYTRLILDVIRGRQAAFVRDDELIRSWEIFTPLLHHLERKKIRPLVYETGSRGPEGADEWVAMKSGYVRNEDYEFHSNM